MNDAICPIDFVIDGPLIRMDSHAAYSHSLVLLLLLLLSTYPSSPKESRVEEEEKKQSQPQELIDLIGRVLWPSRQIQFKRQAGRQASILAWLVRW